MDTIIDTFYNGSLQKYNYTKPRITNNKFSSPNLLESRFKKNNNYNQRYENGQRIMNNNPVPRTQYSMGLQVPTITGHSPVTHTLSYQTINPYSTLKRNYSENIFKLNILNNRINQLEEENRRDKFRINRLMEGSTFSPDENVNFNRTVFNNNPNYMKYLNNPNNLDEAMDNLRNPYLSAEEMAQKQALRREQVQFELDKARQKINEDRITNEIIRQNRQNEMNNREKNYTISNYSDESEEDEDEESSSNESYSKSNSNTTTNNKTTNSDLYQKIKKMERKKDKQRKRELNEMEEKVNEVLLQNHYNNEELNDLKFKNQEMMNNLKQKEEADDFLNNIPDHVALQLQNDNFKMRSNINSIKEGFKEIRNDLENKLEALEMKQNINFDVIRKIIEQGGSKKFNAGLRKYMDGEEIDLNNIREDFPEYIKNIPALIDQKIRENELRKREEKNKLLNEDINKKYDLMEYKYGYANSFYNYKNSHRPPPPNNIPKENQNFVISKNYGSFQYIPNNTKKMKKTYNSFRQNAEQNLKLIKEKENKNPGVYGRGVGNKNMDNYIPIKMNGCFDDWYKDKKRGNDNGQEFQVLESGSEVGINAIKKRVNSKSVKSESKTEKSKKSKKSKEKSEKSASESNSKSSKASKRSKSKKKEKSEASDKSKKKKKSENKKDDDEDEEKEENESEKDKNEDSGNKGSDEENEEKDDEEKDSNNEENESNDNKEDSGDKDDDNSGDKEENSDSDNKDENNEDSNSESKDNSNDDEDNSDNDEDS